MPRTALKSIIKSVLIKEAQALREFAEADDTALVEAINIIQSRRGPVIVSGVGKSGHIARKIASTMRSLGKPAAFLHAAEASHGDLGIIQDEATIIVLSNSGETTELSDLLHYCRTYNLPVISITSSRDSTLAKFSKVVICYGRVDEACLNGLAPTTSTTISLAIGDAIAVGVSHLNKIQPEDFRRWHPGGKLENRLKYVKDVMCTGRDIPRVQPDASIAEALITMSEKSLGSVLVMDGDVVIGLVTDGDMRRNINILKSSRILDIATLNPHYISPDELASVAAQRMSERGITTCIVGSAGTPIQGYLHIHACVN